MTNSQSELEVEFLRLHEARTDFASFCEYIAPHEPPTAAHHQEFCKLADDITSGDKRRVMIFVPPGSAKSTYFSVRFPAYYLGRNGNKGVICASHTERLAQSFGRKVRNLVASTDYRRAFPVALTSDSQAKGEWETDSGGFYYATGVGGSVTGRRADLITADDLVRGRADADSETKRDTTWDWWLDDLRSRLKPNGAIVLIMTRWHEDDVAGRILPDDWSGESGWIEARDGERWYVLCLPAEAKHDDPLGRKPGDWLWTEWFPRDHWEQVKRTTPSRSWNSLYQQDPTPDDGEYFKREWFRRYVDVPRNLGVYMSGDFAVTDDGGDFTELAVWGIDQQYNVRALDWWSGQTNALEWIERWIALVKRYKPRVFVGEMGPIRRAVEPLMRRRMREESAFCSLEWLPSTHDKISHARAFQAMSENGIVYMPKTSWADEVVTQLLKFPAGRYDDKVDACSLIGRYLDKLWDKRPPKVEKKEFRLIEPKLIDFEPDDEFKRMRS